MDELWQRYAGSLSPFTLLVIIPTVLVNSLYALGGVLCLGLDRIPSLRRYKLQDKVNPPASFWTCVKTLLVIKLVAEIPLTVSAFPMLRVLGLQLGTPLPAAWLVAFEIICFFFIEDAWHYFAHRLLHVKWFYKRIHYMHHKFTTPFGMAANYAHPAETMILGFGTVLPLLIVRPHVLTMWLWILCRQLQAICVHVGYDFPTSLRFIPLIGGAAHHDRHHTKYNYNFAPLFTHLDRWFGTEWPEAKDQAQQRTA